VVLTSQHSHLRRTKKYKIKLASEFWRFAFIDNSIHDCNVKCYLINYPHLFDYGQTIFCLSFPSRDRATAPGRYDQFYFTEHVPYPQKIHFEDAIRSEDPVQLFCNSFCVQHKMVGDDYPSILQCLVYCHSAD